METLVLGVDDAGRGPVIGPMVLAGVLCTKPQEDELKLQGVKDSKMLLPSTRKRLFNVVEKVVMKTSIHSASPAEIDESVGGGKKFNLNKLEALKMAQVINVLLEKISLNNYKIEVIIDCPSVNIPAWMDLLKHNLDPNFVSSKNVKLIGEHKADINHPCVSAASVLAKVTRDKEIEKIKKKIGKNFGSGYPSDPLTIDFLKKHGKEFADSGIFRKSWATWKNNHTEKLQKNLEDF